MQPRFRAIDPETGKVSEVFEVSPRHQMDIKDKSFYQFCCQGVTFITQSAPILSQSTGLTDASGTEVFIDDIMKWDGFLYVAEWQVDECAVWFHALPNQRGMELCYSHIEADQVKSATVVGNRYMSPDTLRAMAEEVMNK